MTIECEHCKMCHKEGFPILLTRYAVATRDALALYKGCKSSTLKDSGAPPVTTRAHFKPFESNGEDVPLGQYAYYTLRRLRSGFIYLYNPNALDTCDPAAYPDWGKWQCYRVTRAGNLDPMPLTPPPPPIVLGQGQSASEPKEEKPPTSNEKNTVCKPEKNGAFAAAITISPHNLNNIGTVWIAFSDVRWSRRVISRFEADEDGCRTRSMRPFNVKAWIEGAQQPHAEIIEKASECIAECAFVANPAAFDACRTHAPFNIPNSTVKAWVDYSAVAAQYQLQAPRSHINPAGGGENAWALPFAQLHTAFLEKQAFAQVSGRTLRNGEPITEHAFFDTIERRWRFIPGSVPPGLGQYHAQSSTTIN
jgi:hypothetical protein